MSIWWHILCALTLVSVPFTMRYFDKQAEKYKKETHFLDFDYFEYYAPIWLGFILAVGELCLSVCIGIDLLCYYIGR